jgi:hypothetical protein
MKVVGICGAPAAGKTSLAYSIIGYYNFNSGLLNYNSVKYFYDVDHNILLLGIYNNSGDFEGTDKLSMAVINDAEELIKSMLKDESYDDATIIFEGDRLWCPRWIDFLTVNNTNNLFLYLSVDHEEYARRHMVRRKRGVVQDITFINSRVTKYGNLIRQYPFFTIVKNNDKKDQMNNLKTITDFIDRKSNGSY